MKIEIWNGEEQAVRRRAEGEGLPQFGEMQDVAFFQMRVKALYGWQKETQRCFFLITLDDRGEKSPKTLLPMEEFTLDTWKTALLDSGRELLQEEIQRQLPEWAKGAVLSEMKGPGLNGRPMSEMGEIFHLLSGEKLGLRLSQYDTLLPEKSCGGFFEIEKKNGKQEEKIVSCRGNSGGCAFCAKRENCKDRLRRNEKSDEKKMAEFPKDFSGEFCEREPGYGIAFDLGTTTISMLLWNLQSLKLEETQSIPNPQKERGRDVISRIQYGLEYPQGTKYLQQTLVEVLNRQIDRWKKQGKNICRLSAVGNTAMIHFFYGVSPKGLEKSPFCSEFRAPMESAAVELGLHVGKEVPIYTLPCVGGHLGADAAAVLLALRLKDGEMVVDLGTNGEILLAANGKLWGCSVAAGPAFEGESLNGADRINSVGELLKENWIDETGRFLKEESFLEAKGIHIKQKEIRELQTAKAAIASGCQILLESSGIKKEELSRIYLTGVFGRHIQKESAMRMGLLPQISPECIEIIGNAAGTGASLILLSKKELENGCQRIGQLFRVELANYPNFQEIFLNSMYF